MSLEDADVLRRLHAHPEIWSSIREADGPEMKVQQKLRREFDDDIVRAAFSLSALRKTAAGKWTQADRMWFDRVGMQQATGETVARHVARRFSGRVADLCSGIGGDTLALAEKCDVLSVDFNEARLQCNRYNADVYGVSDRVEWQQADVSEGDLAADFVRIDPDRRAGRSKRAVRIEDYQPSVEYLEQLMQRYRGGAVKLSPASNFLGRFPACEIELVSDRRECKEATLWFGELRTNEPYRATVLPSGESIAGHPLDVAVDVGPLGRYIFDPDPAIVRAGLVDLLADSLGLIRLDREEEYLTGPEPIESPFLQTFAVLTELPNNTRALKQFFRHVAFGEVEVKSRHLPIKADSVRRRLPLAGNSAGVILFARLEGKARIVVAERYPIAERSPTVTEEASTSDPTTD